MAVKDENEKNRKLTQAEEKRLKEFNEKCDKGGFPYVIHLLKFVIKYY